MHTHIFCCVPYTSMGDGQAEISRDTCLGTSNAIFKGISRPGKETKWPAELFSRSAWLSFIGSLNKSQIFIFDFFFYSSKGQTGEAAQPTAERQNWSQTIFSCLLSHTETDLPKDLNIGIYSRECYFSLVFSYCYFLGFLLGFFSSWTHLHTLGLVISFILSLAFGLVLIWIFSSHFAKTLNIRTASHSILKLQFPSPF